MLFVREENIKSAIVIMRNRLYCGRDDILKPLMQCLVTQDKSGTFVKIEELETKIKETTERIQVLTGLMAKGYLDPALFNTQNNVFKTEITKLKEEKIVLAAVVNGEQSAVTHIEELYRYLSKSTFTEEYSDDFFERFVDRITIFSADEISFRLKCGLNLRERMAR